MTKLELIQQMIALEETREASLECPDDVRYVISAIHETKYVNSLTVAFERLCNKYLGERLYEEVMWFLYDRPKNSATITVDEKVYNITDSETFIAYLNEEYKDALG